MDEQNDDNKKGFVVALISIATICTIIFVGIIFFFPNKNFAPNITEQNIVIEDTKATPEVLKQNEEKDENLEVSETNNEIVIDLTKDLKKNRNATENKEIVKKEDIAPLENKPEDLNKVEKDDTNASSKIKDIPETKPEKNKKSGPTPEVPKKENKSSQKVQKDEIKEKPKSEKDKNEDEKYDPNKEHYIQFASLSNPIIADDSIKNLNKYNLNAKIYSATVNDKEIYRVRSGPYKTVAEAKRDLSKIAGASEFKDAYILTVKK